MPTSSKRAWAIQVDNIGKRYRIGKPSQSESSTPSDHKRWTWKRLHQAGSPLGLTRAEWFWALKHISFEVAPGERVGIIGRNGAGKSTLLKILARITYPTEGHGQILGRVGSLLEVGTGFHPELTGRNNIFLSGAILGMRQRDIKARANKIIDFAGIERFIDTPVKRYSSGMYLRLAFAVAAHLESEILLIDEVLAVGDAEFQKKCLGRLGEMGGEGRTVLFVSHSMPAVLRLCDRVILLDSGKIVADGSAQSAIRAYLDSGIGAGMERSWNAHNAPGDEIIRLKSVRVLSEGRVTDEIDIRKSVDIEVTYWHLPEQTNLRPIVNLHFFNEEGVLLFIAGDATNVGWRHSPRRRGVVSAVCHIPGNFLAEGRHFVLAGVTSINPTRIHVQEPDSVSFQVVDRSVGDAVRGDWVNQYPGAVRPMFQWTIDVDIDRSAEDQAAGFVSEGPSR